MHALDTIQRVLRTRVSATIEEHEQIMAAFNDVAKAVSQCQQKPFVDTDEIPMPGKVSDRNAV